MAHEECFAARGLLICSPWPCHRNDPILQNEMFHAVDDLLVTLGSICGAYCKASVSPSLQLFDKDFDLFTDECVENNVKVIFLYICSHGKIDSGKLRLLLRRSDELTDIHLREKIEYLRFKVPNSKVIVFLECCHAGALIPGSLGIKNLFEHPFKKKVKEDSNHGTVLFMSCEREEGSNGCIFARSIVEILKKHKKSVTAKTLVDEVSEMIKSLTRNSCFYFKQSPTFKCVPENGIAKIGIIGGCDETEPMEVDSYSPSYSTLGNIKKVFQGSWTEGTYKKKCEEAKGLLEDLRTEFSEELREQVDTVIEKYYVDSLETRIVFCGESGCGKSTLINAMVGCGILPCSGGDSGCTSTVIEIRENKHSKKFKTKIEFMEKSKWIKEAERLRETLTNEECEESEQAKDLLKKVYGNINVQVLDLPQDVEQYFKDGIIELEEEKHKDLSKKLNPFVSSGSGQERGYWPIVKKVEIFIPNCDILQGGLVLVDIPGFVDPNPVRKDIAEKEYEAAENVCVCSKTARSGANEMFKKLVKDYNENLRGKKEVTFVLTRSDDDMQHAESYFESLESFADDCHYLNDLHKKVDEDSDDDDYHFENFKIECAKHRNRESRANLQLKLKEENVEDGSFKRPVYSVSGLDYMFLKKVTRGKPFFKTPEETGVPDLINNLKRTAGNHAILNFHRFLLECKKLPAKLEKISNSSDVTENIESDLSTALKELEKKEVETEKLCEKLFQEIEKAFDEALEKDFQTARVDDVCSAWSKYHYMTLKAAFMRNGKYVTPNKRHINLNADLLHNTVAVFRRNCAERVKKIKLLISDFFEKELNAFVESEREKHPERKPALLTVEENGKIMEDDVCESLAKFSRVLRSETLEKMSEKLMSLYLQLVQQNDFKLEARSKFVRNALKDIKIKNKLKRSINISVSKEKFMCREKLKEFVDEARQQMSSSLYDKNVAAESGVSRSILNFKKGLDNILEFKEERGNEGP